MGFSENIKNLRNEHHLTQEQLGKIAGVTDRAVSTWEKGKAFPRIGAIERMAQHFGISKSEIIEDRDIRLAMYWDQLKKLDDVDLARIGERIDIMLEDEKYHVD